MKRALEKYDVNVIGLTLSKNQHAHTSKLLDEVDTNRSVRVLLRGWEQFSEPVDRIVSIEAIEHFGFERFDDFFKKSYSIMPDDGRMTIQSTTGMPLWELVKSGKATTEGARFVKFLLTEIFPGGRIPSAQMLIDHGEKAGFIVPECLSLRSHYVQTLETWASSLEANKDKAIEVTSEEIYNRYVRYLRGCHFHFADEGLDCSLVAYMKPGARRECDTRISFPSPQPCHCFAAHLYPTTPPTNQRRCMLLMRSTPRRPLRRVAPASFGMRVSATACPAIPG